MTAAAQKKPMYTLPTSIVSRSDIARLVRELESVENDLQAQRVRGASDLRLPHLSKALGDFSEENKLNLLDGQTVTELKRDLRILKDHAPQAHMTFAAGVEPEALEELVAWLRKEVSPQAVVSTGIQPSLVGGVYLRTPNRVHDFSLKARLKGQRDIILKQLEGLGGR